MITDYEKKKKKKFLSHSRQKTRLSSCIKNASRTRQYVYEYAGSSSQNIKIAVKLCNNFANKTLQALKCNKGTVSRNKEIKRQSQEIRGRLRGFAG